MAGTYLKVLQDALEAIKRVQNSEFVGMRIVVMEQAMIVLLGWAIQCERAAGTNK